MKKIFLEATFTPSFVAAREARQALHEAMKEAYIDRDLDNNFKLAVSEIIVNLVKHSHPPPKYVKIIFGRSGDEFILDVLDDGGEFSSFDNQMALQSLGDDLEENGMGLRMVAILFDHYEYTPGSMRLGGKNRFRVSMSGNSFGTGLPRIVLVDDDPVIRWVLETYLSGNYDVVPCSSAGEAVDALKNQTADLVISDIRMPKVSGIQLCRKMSEDARTSIIPFIFLTALDDEKTHQALESLAIDDYLVKPVTKERLLTVTQRVLKRASHVKCRLEERLDDAITSSLHPSLPPHFGGFKTSVRWRSAGAGGGDLLFHRQYTEGQVVVLADLMGHGEQAKFFSHAVAGYLHGMLGGAVDSPSPAEILNKLTEALNADRVLNRTIVTLLVVFLKDDGEIKIASAGHPPPLIARDGKFIALDVGGPLPGLVSGHAYTEISTRLNTGIRMVLYTDGLVEVGDTPSERHQSEESIRAAIDDSIGMPLKSAADHVLTTFDRLCRRGPDDDATIVLLEKT